MLDKRRIIQLHAALNAAQALPFKADMLAAYGVESSKELTAAQADELIGRLNDMQEERKKEAPKATRKLRSQVLTLINQLGIYADNGDWSKVNQFLLKPKIAGKLLYEMDKAELEALKRKLHAMVRKREKQIQEENFKATNN